MTTTAFPTIAEQQEKQIKEGLPVDATKWKLSDLELLQTLGTGSYARVRLCKHKSTNEHYAIKILKKDDILKMNQVEHIISERKTLTEVAESLHHPFIANLFCAFQDDDKLYLVLEFVIGGEIFSTLRSVGKFPNDVAKFYIAEIVLAFEHMHSKDIIYRDLKPENCLLDAKGHIKITDFGFAKKVPERTFTLCGTPEYLAPEVIQSKGHGKAVDWWTMGILLYEFIAGYPPFFDESQVRVYEKIIEGKIKFPTWMDVRARELIKGLLTTDPTRRLGALKNSSADIRNHAYFSSCNWDKLYAKYYNAPIPVKVKGPGDTSNFQTFAESDGELHHNVAPSSNSNKIAYNGSSTTPPLASSLNGGGDSSNTNTAASEKTPGATPGRNEALKSSTLTEAQQAEFKEF